MTLYPPPVPLTFIERKHEYGEVYSYYFEPSEQVTFTAGEYAHVRLLSLPEDTRRVRELSFASAPQDRYIQFGIDGSSGSDYQKALKSLAPGDTVEVFKIKGHMTWPSPVPQAVMIAGGVGVTPFRSMIRDAAQRNLPIETSLLHIARESFLYRDELCMLASTYRATDREGLPKELDPIVTVHRDAQYYVAGSPRFVEAVTRELKQYGVTRIETDEFKGLSDESLRL